MYLLLGNFYMDRRNFEDAVRSFKRARAQLHDHTSKPPLVISLVSSLLHILQWLWLPLLTDNWMEI